MDVLEVQNATAKGKTLSVADAIPSHPLHERDLTDNASAKQTVPQSCSIAALKQLSIITPDSQPNKYKLICCQQNGQACHGHVSCKYAFVPG